MAPSSVATPISPAQPTAASNHSAAHAAVTNPQHEDLRQKLELKTKQLDYVQKAYWALKADFDKFCGAINQRQSRNRGKSTANLRTISETQPIEYVVNDLQTKLKVKNAELTAMRQSVDKILKEKEEMTKRNEVMREEVDAMRLKLKNVMEKNSKLSKLTVSVTQKRRIRKKTMSELYLNSNRYLYLYR